MGDHQSKSKSKTKSKSKRPREAKRETTEGDRETTVDHGRRNGRPRETTGGETGDHGRPRETKRDTTGGETGYHWKRNGRAREAKREPREAKRDTTGDHGRPNGRPRKTSSPYPSSFLFPRGLVRQQARRSRRLTLWPTVPRNRIPCTPARRPRIAGFHSWGKPRQEAHGCG